MWETLQNNADWDRFCEQNTLTRHIFSCLRALLLMSHMTLAQGVSAGHTIHVSCACVFDLSLTLPSHSSVVSHIFYFILLNIDFRFRRPCGCCRSKIPCALRPMRSVAYWPTTRLPQVTSSISTARRPLKFSSRSNPATPGLPTCMTRRSAATPSAQRSLHH